MTQKLTQRCSEIHTRGRCGHSRIIGLPSSQRPPGPYRNSPACEEPPAWPATAPDHAPRRHSCIQETWYSRDWNWAFPAPQSPTSGLGHPMTEPRLRAGPTSRPGPVPGLGPPHDTSAPQRGALLVAPSRVPLTRAASGRCVASPSAPRTRSS